MPFIIAPAEPAFSARTVQRIDITVKWPGDASGFGVRPAKLQNVAVVVRDGDRAMFCSFAGLTPLAAGAVLVPCASIAGSSVRSARHAGAEGGLQVVVDIGKKNCPRGEAGDGEVAVPASLSGDG